MPKPLKGHGAAAGVIVVVVAVGSMGFMVWRDERSNERSVCKDQTDAGWLQRNGHQASELPATEKASRLARLRSRPTEWVPNVVLDRNI
jgi:hypothetical protein